MKPKVITPGRLTEISGQITVLIRLEHLGDILACEPVVRYIREKYSGTALAWVLKEAYFEAVEGNRLIDFLVPATSLAEAGQISEKCAAAGQRVINLHFNGQRCSDTGLHVPNRNNPEITWRNYFQAGSLLAAFCRSAGLPALSDAPRFHFTDYLQPPPLLPAGFAVIHAKSNDSRKDWSEEKWGQLADFLFSRKLAVAEVGFKRVVARSGHALYYDLTGLRSIQSIAAVIKSAGFFFGVDSGFAHLANALRVPGLVIMGRLGDYTDHMPFTGLYAEGRSIIRAPGSAAAAAVDVDTVVEYFLRWHSGREGA